MRLQYKTILENPLTYHLIVVAVAVVSIPAEKLRVEYVQRNSRGMDPMYQYVQCIHKGPNVASTGNEKHPNATMETWKSPQCDEGVTVFG